MRSNQLSYRAIQRSGVLVSRLRVQKYDKFSKHQRFSQLFLKKNSLFGILGRKSGVRGIELASLSADFGTWLRQIGDLIFQSLGLKIQKAGLKIQSLGLNIQKAGLKIQKAGLKIQSLGLKIQKAGLKSQSLRAGERTQKCGRLSPARCLLLYNKECKTKNARLLFRPRTPPNP